MSGYQLMIAFGLGMGAVSTSLNTWTQSGETCAHPVRPAAVSVVSCIHWPCYG